MEIIFSDSLTFDKILSELSALRDTEPGKFFDNKDFSPSETFNPYENYNFNRQVNKIKFEYASDENLKFSVYEKKIKLEYYETKPPHSRVIFTEQIEEIFSSLECLSVIELCKLDKASWFCINWSPFKSSRPQFASTSFLTYYGFCYSDVEMFYTGTKNLFLEIPVIGILPVKFDESRWLRKITKGKKSVKLVTFANTSYTSSLIDFKMALNDSVVNYLIT